MAARVSRARAILVLGAVIGLAWVVLLNGSAFHAFLASAAGSRLAAMVPTLSVCAVTAVIGHVLRTQRTRVLLDQVRHGPLASQFGATAVGYFFDLVFPLRIGELVRAALIARRLRISLLYSVVAILLERLLDIVVVAAAFLLAGITGHLPVVALGIAGAAAVVALLALGLLWFFFARNRASAGIVWRISRLFNDDLQRRVRMSVWTVSRGLQQFAGRPRNVIRYAAWALASWACYLLAAGLWLGVLGSGVPVLSDVLAPFVYPDALFNIQSFASYVTTLAQFYDVSGLVADSWLAAGGMWVVLNLPIMVIGFLAALIPRCIRVRVVMPWPRAGNRVRASSSGADREPSGPAPGRNLAEFLDSYFQRHAMARVLHEREVAGDLELLQFYRGGSDAVTALVRESGGLKVLKLVPHRYEESLRRQHDWLAGQASNPIVVEVLGERRDDHCYQIELAYRPSSIPFFDYIHTHPIERSLAILTSVWRNLGTNLYQVDEASQHPAELRAYLCDRLHRRLEIAASEHELLAAAIRCETVIVNGHEYRGLNVVLDLVESHESAMHDLETWQSAPSIHGDLTIDNILVDAVCDEPILIDPSDDNQIRGPIIDVARQLQSLWGGYEFLDDAGPLTEASIGADRLTINVPVRRSFEYGKLAAWLESHAGDILTPPEVRSLPFHVGLFYARMLTHRVAINPDTVLTYLAPAIVFLNRFHEQYGD